MPNWCWNVLNVSGSKEEMEKFYAILEKEEALEIIVEKSLLEEKKNEDLNLLKDRDNGQWVRNNLKEYLRIKNLSIEEFYNTYKNLTFDELGNACKRPEKGMLSKFYPMPEKTEVNGEMVDTDWYNWRINNWGTKWDVDIDNDIKEENEFQCYFDSAWSPPTNWLEKVASDFPKLHFILNYEESGCGFKGQFDICIEDDIYSDECGEWHGDCGDCEEDYDSNGKCGCIGENGKPLEWGEESEWEDED
jgi:hypothetical protein